MDKGSKRNLLKKAGGLLLLVLLFSIVFSASFYGMLDNNGKFAAGLSTSGTTTTFLPSDAMGTSHSLNNCYTTGNWLPASLNEGVGSGYNPSWGDSSDYWNVKIGFAANTNLIGPTGTWDDGKRWSFGTLPYATVGFWGQSDQGDASVTFTMTHTIVIPKDITSLNFSADLFAGTDRCNSGNRQHYTRVTGTLLNGTQVLSTDSAYAENYQNNQSKNTKNWSGNNIDVSSVPSSGNTKTLTLQLKIDAYKRDVSGWGDRQNFIGLIGNIKINYKGNYYLSFNSNGGNGTMSNQTLAYGSAQSIKSNTFTKSGNYFYGWSENNSGIRNYTDMQNVINLSAEAGKVINLYAIWKDISFVFDGKNFNNYNNQTLQILQTHTNTEYLKFQDNTIASGFSGEITYDNGLTEKPTELGEHTAVLTITDNTTSKKWSRTISFTIIDGDFGKLAGGTGAWGSETNPYVISTRLHLLNLSGITNGTQPALNSIAGIGDGVAGEVIATDIGYGNSFFVFGADIDMNGVSFVPISGNYPSGFGATVDGNNRTVGNIVISANTRTGLFGYFAGVLKNLNLTGNLNFSSTQYIGSFAGEMTSGIIENCVSRINVTGSDYVGGIVGIMHGGIIENCQNYGSVSGAHDVGGIAGRVNGNSSIIGCGNYGTVLQRETSAVSLGGVGGIVGRVNNAGSAVIIENCVNGSNAVNAKIHNFASGDYVGGIIGYISPDAASVTLKGTLGNYSQIGTNGTTVYYGNYVGGIIGYGVNVLFGSAASDGVTLQNYNFVGGASYIGGIFGYLEDRAATAITRNLTAENIWQTAFSLSVVGGDQIHVGAQFGGGIFGYLKGANLTLNALLKNTMTVDGEYKSSAIIGGIVGLNDGAYIKGSYDEATGLMSVSSYGSEGVYARGTASDSGYTGAFAGGIAGINKGRIQFAAFTGQNVISVLHGSYIGGIAGLNLGAIESCSVSGASVGAVGTSVFTANYAGGIAGASYGGSIRYCFVEQNVKITGTGYGYSGGVAGETDSEIAGCVSLSEVAGANYAGGIAGRTAGSGKVSGSVAVADKVGATSNGGGVIGGGSAENSWAIYSATKPAAFNSLGKYIQTNGTGFIVKPYSHNGSDYVVSEWKAALLNGISGIGFDGAASYGNYLSIKEGDAYAAPSKLVSSDSGTEIAVNAVFALNNANSAVSVSVEGIPDLAKNSHIYDTTTHSMALKSALYGVGGIYFSKTFTDVADSGEVIGTVYSSPHGSTERITTGKRKYTYTINKFDISLSSNSSTAVYVGPASGETSSSTYGGYVWATNAVERVWNTPFLIYNGGFDKTGFENKAASDWIIIHIGDKGDIKNYGAKLSVSLNGYTTDSSGVGYFSFTIGALTGAKDNFTGSITLQAYLTDGDFGVTAGKSRTDGTWGSEANPYVISHWAHMLRLSQIVNGASAPWNSVSGQGELSIEGLPVSGVSTKCSSISYSGGFFRLAAAVELNSAVKPSASAWSDSVSVGYGFRPIGVFPSSGTVFPFSGTFDGANGSGFKVKLDLGDGLSNIANVSLFGHVDGAIVKNLTIGEGSTVTGPQTVAGAVASGLNSVLENILNYASVRYDDKGGTVKIIGGIIGRSQNTTVKNCKNYGVLTSSQSTYDGLLTGSGGIVGRSDSGIIEACENYGSVQMPYGLRVGGIVGYANGTSISGCANKVDPIYSRGPEISVTAYSVKYASEYYVNGYQYVGGIAGLLEGGYTVLNCYNNFDVFSVRAVSTTVVNIGGIIGAAGSGGTIKYLVNEGRVISLGTHAGGIGGASELAGSNQVDFVYNFGLVVGTSGTSLGAAFGTSGRIDAAYVYSFFADTDTPPFKYNLFGFKIYYSLDASKNPGLVSDGELTPLANGLPTTWENIVSDNIHGWKYTVTPKAGYYLAISPDNTNASTIFAEVDSKYSAPTESSHVNSAAVTVTLNKDTSTFNNPIGYVLIVKEIELSDHTLTYDTQLHSLDESAPNAAFKNSLGRQSDALSLIIYHFLGGVTVDAPTNAGVYSVTAQICYRDLNKKTDYVVGSKSALTLTISPRNLSDVVFGFEGYASNDETITIKGVEYHKLQQSLSENYNGIIKALLYGRDLGPDQFKLFFNLVNPLQLVRSTDYDFALEYKGADGNYSTNLPQGVDAFEARVQFRGKTNYIGNLYVNFVMMNGDFGVMAGKSRIDGTWGEESNPYLITHWAHFVRLSQIVNGISEPWDSISRTNAAAGIGTACIFNSYGNGFFVQTADISKQTVNGVEYAYLSANYGFAPIGMSETVYFSASYDGGGHKVILDVDLPDADYVGLFGSVNDGGGFINRFENINIEGSVRGKNNVGALVGYIRRTQNARNVIVENVINTAAVTGIGNVGGLIGYAYHPDIKNSDNRGVITGQSKVGGIAGYAYTTSADNLRNFGAINGDSNVGGIFGDVLNGNDDSIGNLENNGTVISQNPGEANTGGLMGKMADGSLIGSLINSGEVTGKGTHVGGLIGYAHNVNILVPGSQSNKANVSGAGYVGGLIGYYIGFELYPAAVHIVSPVVSGTISATSEIGYVGALFGKMWGPGYKLGYDINPASDGTTENTAVLNNSSISAEVSNVPQASFVGRIAGYLGDFALYSPYWKNTQPLSGADFVGGAVGYLGMGGTLIGRFENSAAIHAAGKGAGGIIGYITSGAGAYYAENTYLVGGGNTVDSNGAKQSGSLYINTGAISGTELVGGVVGAMGEPADGTASYKYTRYHAVSQNYGSVSATGSYAGGLIGRVSGGSGANDEVYSVVSFVGEYYDSASVPETLTEAPAGAYVETLINADGTITLRTYYTQIGKYSVTDQNDRTEITATEYAGGAIGRLDGANSLIRGVGSTAKVTASANYAGGITGYMSGGFISGCFVTVPDTIDIKPDDASVVQAPDNAGGIAGYMAGGTLENCYAQGYNYTDVTQTKGGVTGFKHPTNAKINDCWAVYIVKVDPNRAGYTYTSANTNGKFVILDAEFATLMTYSECRAAVKENGVISLGITIPDGNDGTVINNDKNIYQRVFYDASGNERATANNFKNLSNDAAESVTKINFGFTADVHSFSVFSGPIRFGNVTDYQNTTAWENAYIKPNNNERYSANITSASKTGQNYVISGTVNYTVNGHSAIVGKFNNVYYPDGSSVAPLIIKNQTDWNNFANSIRSGNTYVGKFVSLATDSIVITNKNQLAGNIDFGENSGIGDLNGQYFAGTFDGQGHYLTINYSATGTENTKRVSVFPNAAGAEFRNLTIKGYITVKSDSDSYGYDAAAFVAKPFGDLAFYNCVNDANITARRVAAGIVGYTTGYNLTLVDCTNNGNITTRQLTSSYGTGGIIANVENNTTVESCKNNGSILGEMNVGGIVGRVSNATLTVKNSANTGLVRSNTRNVGEDDSRWSAVGGILGKATASGNLWAYGCYNSGEIIAARNIAGGIVGMIGDLSIVNVTRAESASHSGYSQIAYCYNSGNVTTGGTTPGAVATYGYLGSICGGIAGYVCDTDFYYCYNTGTLTANGGIGFQGAWHSRIGGIAAYTRSPNDRHYYIKNCYNVGQLINADTENRGFGYSAGIVGYIYYYWGHRVSEADYVHISQCYSLQNQLYTAANKGYSNSGDFNSNVNQNGTVLASLADFTAVYTQDGGQAANGTKYAGRILPMSGLTSGSNPDCFGVTGSAKTLMSDNGVYLDPDTDPNYLNGTAEGWVYPYGCLPQLAVFALDTKNGLSMHSKAYVADQYGQYHLESAGSKNNPYIISDGIDLLSMSALNQSTRGDVWWNGSGKYIEFANGENNNDKRSIDYINMAAPQKLRAEGDTSIGMSGSVYAPDNARCYQTNTGGAFYKGKSYHLFTQGAVIRDSPNSGSDTYLEWIARNYKPSGNTAGFFTQNATLDDVNFYPTGVTEKRVFSANISGEQANGRNTEIRNLKVNYDGKNSVTNVGFFGRVQDAVIKNITVSGDIRGRSWGPVYAGLVAYTGSTTLLQNLQAGENDRPLNISITNGSSDSYVGGIVGQASTVYKEYTSNTDYPQIHEYRVGSQLTISGCVVKNAVIKSSKLNVGGILGYADGGNNTSVKVDGCKVLKADISTTWANASYIGGIGGGRSSGNRDLLYSDGTETGYLTKSASVDVTYAIMNCEVGNVAFTTAQNTSSVIIRGDNIVGGILGSANGDTTLNNCSVYGDVSIVRNGKTDDLRYDTAIGGIIGVIDGACVIGGETEFFGTLDLNPALNYLNSDNPRNVGGIAGYMGAGANIADGSINVGGKFVIDSDDGTKVIPIINNLGGIAGYAQDTVFNGRYTISSDIVTAHGNNVGGFIGLNAGACVVLGGVDSVQAVSVGSNASRPSLKGVKYVGGLIGKNEGTVDLGPNSYGGVDYSKGRLTVVTYADVDGLGFCGGIIGGNYGTVSSSRCTAVNNGRIGSGGESNGTPDDAIQKPTENSNYAFYGGLFGANLASGTVTLGEAAEFSNFGKVGFGTAPAAGAAYAGESYQQAVGGIFGMTEGKFQSLAKMTNTGEVYGNRLVGGVIGWIVKGEIGGYYTNESTGNVYGSSYTGGSVGLIDKDAIITTSSFENKGAVTGTSDSEYIGGAIGVFLGTMRPAVSGDRIYFSNAGTVSAHNKSGGLIGVLSGSATGADFINMGKVSFTGGDALGGTIGWLTSLNSQTAGVATPTSVVNCNFEFITGNLEKTQVVATGQSTNNVGGVGGIFGIIDASDIREDTASRNSAQWVGNTFYVNGDINAPNATYVGGVVGKISGAYIRINNMLAYKNTVTGSNFVGGIVGYNGSTRRGTGEESSLVNCYNVGGTVTANQTNGIAGGIVGGVADGTMTYACYWVKGFSNQSLANCNIDNLSETLDATFTIVFTAEQIAGDPVPSGDYTVGNETHQVPAGINNWQDFITWYNSLDGVTAVQPNSNGDYGYYSSSGKSYSTGKTDGSTGFYFVYANDAASYASEAINVTHSGDGKYNELDFWKFIADAYSSDERDRLPADYSLQSMLAPPVNGAMGAIEYGHLYATAMPGNVDGYYLYIRNSNKDLKLVADFLTGADGTSRFYIDAKAYNKVDETGGTADNAGNVLIFYKQVRIDKNITYNGLQRMAPISEKELEGRVFLSFEDANKANIQPNQYYMVLEGNNAETGINLGLIAGQYNIVGTIYYKLPGDSVSVGRINSLAQGSDGSYKWNITKRTLNADSKTSASASGNKTTYDAKNHSITFTVDNITGADYPIDATDKITQLGFAFNNYAVKFQTPPTAANAEIGVVYARKTKETAMSGSDLKHISPNASAASADRKTYAYEFTVFFKNAGVYEVQASLSKATPPNYSMAAEKITLTIERRELTVTPHFNGGTSHVYNGVRYGVTMVFDNFAKGYSGETDNESTETAEGGGTIRDLLISAFTADGKNTDEDPQYNNTAEAKNELIWTALEVGVYTLSCNASEIGTNYKLPATIIEWAITEYEAWVIWDWTNAMQTMYSGVVQKFTATLTSVVPGVELSDKAWAEFIDVVKATCVGGNGVDIVPDNTNQTIRFTFKAKNAKTYTAKVELNNNTSFTLKASVDPYRPTSQTFTITKAPLTFTPTWSDKQTSPTHSPFTYNGNVQGLTQISITGLKNGEYPLTSNITAIKTGGISATNKNGTNNIIIIDSKKDVGDYSVKLSPGVSDNYTFPTITYSWKINPYALSASVLWTDGSNGDTHSNFIYSTVHQGIESIEFDIFASDPISSVLKIDSATNGISSSMNNSNKSIRFTGAVDAGAYAVSIGIQSSNKNYTFKNDTSPKSYSWTINKKPISLGKIQGGGTFTYDAVYHTASVAISGDGVSSQNGVYRYGNDTLNVVIAYNSVYGTNTNGACNVGVYTLNLSEPGGFMAERGGKSVVQNYDVGNTSAASTLTITPAVITVLSWTDVNLVYLGAAQGAKVNGISIGNTASVSGGSNVFTVKYGNLTETITFAPEGADGENAGRYNASVGPDNFTVSGKNAAGPTSTANYTLNETGDNSEDYQIHQSAICLEITALSPKEYDGTSKHNKGEVTFSVVAVETNGLKGKAIEKDRVSFTDITLDQIGVGTQIPTEFEVVISAEDANNYLFVDNSGATLQSPVYTANVGIITARELEVEINTTSSNKAYMTYNGTNVYGSVSSNGSSGSKTSTPFRSGQGFTVSRLLTSSIDSITINALFMESESGRSAFDSYINNVVKTGDGAAAEYSVGSGYFKKLRFSISGSGYLNYVLKITGYNENCVMSQDDGARSKYLDIFDSREIASDRKNPLSTSISISIEKYQFTATYENTSQSYAKSDNTLTQKDEWLSVTGKMPTQMSDKGVKIDITQGWMNGEDNRGTYSKYTRIVGAPEGKAGFDILGAKLVENDFGQADYKNDGLTINYVLRNQPVLVIGYFVKSGDYYEVGSLAGLMLATYYYDMTFADASSLTQTVDVWNQICSLEEYDTNSEVPAGFASWQAYIDDMVQKALDEGITIEPVIDTYLNSVGYWSQEEVTRESYLKFRQVANISGVLTAEDLVILSGQFGASWGYGNPDDNGNYYIENFINTTAGNTVTAIGSFFRGVFAGEYDGNGYVIDGVNITSVHGSAVSQPISSGFFESYGTKTYTVKDDSGNNKEIVIHGKIVNTHLRNVNITLSNYSSGNELYIGGLIGSIIDIAAPENALSDCSFHGAITVNAPNSSATIGAIAATVGAQVQNAVRNVIALGSIDVTAKNVNAGGIIGALASGGSIADAVSAVSVYSSASQTNNIGGVIGIYNGTTISDLAGLNAVISGVRAYISGSVVNAVSKTAVNRIVGNSEINEGALTYTQLRAGSQSAYGEQGYIGSEARGIYDVLNKERNYTPIQNVSPHESTRLNDIIDVYVLGFTKTLLDYASGDAVIKVYGISDKSPLTGSAKGTDSDRIAISNQQQLGLLRMFRFASFELKNNIAMYAGYKHVPVRGAFFGKVVSNRFEIDLGAGCASMFEVDVNAVPIRIY